MPEGLPILATIALARGMGRMAKQNALVNRLSAVETLGATQILCTDKTGTLTENEMRVVSLEVVSAADAAQRALEVAVLCNNASLDGAGDSTEVALLEFAATRNVLRDNLADEFPEQHEVAFDSDVMMILGASVFARVSPKQKLDLIALHQNAGSVVAMTGDGVNDAPALNKVDIGVAMGKRGTAAAREAADMVLKDDNLQTMVVAIREGRVIFDNIRKFVVYLLSCNISEVLVVSIASLVGLPLPLTPLQILFLNLVIWLGRWSVARERPCPS